MAKRYLSLWFPHLTTDRMLVRQPELREHPLVLTAKTRGRVIITAANIEAERHGINVGMAAADAKAIVPGLKVMDEIPDQNTRLLNAIGEWCIRYTPVVATDMPDGLILDISGCAHLWGGEEKYIADITARLNNRGYDTRAAIADTIGVAWATARFTTYSIVEPGRHQEALLQLSPAALRLEPVILQRLQKLGFRKVESFINMKRSVLRRRFGQGLLQRLDEALGVENEVITPLQPIALYEKRLPCLDPIRTGPGIEIVVKKLLVQLCKMLQNEGKGIRTAILKCYRIDGQTIQIEIGTNRASVNTEHLFRLFELKIPGIEPALGIELFVLEAPKVDDITAEQETIWTTDDCNLDDARVAELLDRIGSKMGPQTICRYLPQEHHWPERSIKSTSSLLEKPATAWRTDNPRPTQLLARPERIEVMVQIPDYPPVHFIHNKTLHIIKKADGPERIEREWWLEAGDHRDYYIVEDEAGKRYWIFRSGHYSTNTTEWFIHGYFA